jgi:hypothetical protein
MRYGIADILRFEVRVTPLCVMAELSNWGLKAQFYIWKLHSFAKLIYTDSKQTGNDIIISIISEFKMWQYSEREILSLISKKYFLGCVTIKKGICICNVLDWVQITEFSINLHYPQNIFKYDLDVSFYFNLCIGVKSEYKDPFYMSRDPYNKNVITTVR